MASLWALLAVGTLDMSESVKATPVVRGASGGGRREGECGKDGSQVNAEAPYSLSLFLCPSVPRESTRKSVDDDQG